MGKRLCTTGQRLCARMYNDGYHIYIYLYGNTIQTEVCLFNLTEPVDCDYELRIWSRQQKHGKPTQALASMSSICRFCSRIGIAGVTYAFVYCFCVDETTIRKCTESNGESRHSPQESCVVPVLHVILQICRFHYWSLCKCDFFFEFFLFSLKRKIGLGF